MADTTARLGLYRPDDNGAENINVTTDLNNNWSKLDSKVGAFPCTSGNRPSTPYDGQFIRETDTGKLYVCSNPVGPVWTQVLFGTASFGNSIALGTSTNQVNIGGSNSSGNFVAKRATTGNVFSAVQITGDTENRWAMQSDGKQTWGPGGATVPDTNFYRSAAGVLHTDGDLEIGDALTVSGPATFDGLSTFSDGEFMVGSAKKRSALSSLSNVANTTAETALVTRTIPAGDAVVGAVYKIKAWGDLSVAAATSPTLTLRGRIGGLSGGGSLLSSITIRSGATAASWELEFYASCTAIGGSGNFNTMVKAQHNFLTSAVTFSIIGPIVAGATTDTTIARDMVLTAQWGTASASNIINCTGVVGERVL